MSATVFVTFPRIYDVISHPSGGHGKGYVTIVGKDYVQARDYAIEYLSPLRDILFNPPTGRTHPRGQLFRVDLDIASAPPIPWKEPAMPARRTRADIEREIKDTSTKLEILQEELDNTPALPKDVYRNGTIVTFCVQFDATGVVYKYAALKHGVWYLTGTSGPKTWDDVVRLMMQDHSIREGGATLEFQVFQIPDTVVSVPVHPKKGC